MRVAATARAPLRRALRSNPRPLRAGRNYAACRDSGQSSDSVSTGLHAEEPTPGAERWGGARAQKNAAAAQRSGDRGAVVQGSLRGEPRRGKSPSR